MPDDLMAPGPHQTTSRRGFFTGAAALGAAAGLGAPPAAGAEPAPNGAVANPRLFAFVGGKAGEWVVTSAAAAVGAGLPAAERVTVVAGAGPAAPAGGWALRGVTSNERYVTRPEKDELVRKQAALGRPEATHAAVIPIKKSAAWWALTPDDRRAIFEAQSKHVTIGLKYLPAVARRLFHCRDLSAAEPFDFITQFDYAKADAPAFDDMVAELRAGVEWKYVEREVDIRLVRSSG